MTKMALTEKQYDRSYSRGIAIVLGIIVLFTFTMILISAAPGKQMLSADGSHSSNPISGLANMYNQDNIRCAFQAGICNFIS